MNTNTDVSKSASWLDVAFPESPDKACCSSFGSFSPIERDKSQNTDDDNRRTSFYGFTHVDLTSQPKCADKNGSVIETNGKKKAATTAIGSFDVQFALCCLSIVLYFVDYILDFILVVKYYRLQINHSPYVVYFWLSVGFCLLPPILGIIYELIWTCEEKAARTVEDRSEKMGDLLRLFFAFIFLGPLMKFVLSIVYEKKSRKPNNDNIDWKRRAEVERSQAAFLCVVEKFVESSLHLIHQLSLIRTEWHTEHRIYIDWIEWLKVGICLFLMPFTLTVYASFRRTAEGRTSMNMTAGSVHFVWALLLISSQAASMSLFATYQPVFFSAICTVHYCLCFVYICTLAMPPSRRFFVSHEPTESLTHETKKVSCGCVAAESFHRIIVSYLFFYVFLHLKPGTSSDSGHSQPNNTTVATTTINPLRRTGSTLHPAFVFYALLLLERSIMVVIWNENCIRRGPADFDCQAVLVSFFAAFAAGLILMTIYYACFHPSKKRVTIDAYCRRNKDDESSKPSRLRYINSQNTPTP